MRCVFFGFVISLILMIDVAVHAVPLSNDDSSANNGSVANNPTYMTYPSTISPPTLPSAKSESVEIDYSIPTTTTKSDSGESAGTGVVTSLGTVDYFSGDSGEVEDSGSDYDDFFTSNGNLTDSDSSKDYSYYDSNFSDTEDDDSESDEFDPTPIPPPKPFLLPRGEPVKSTTKARAPTTKKATTARKTTARTRKTTKKGHKG